MEHAVDTGRPKVVIIWEANLHCALSIDKMEGWGSIWTNYWRSKIKISWKSLGIPENIMENMKYQVSLIQDKAHSIKSRGWGTQEDCFSVVRSFSAFCLTVTESLKPMTEQTSSQVASAPHNPTNSCLTDGVGEDLTFIIKCENTLDSCFYL